jgi:hypothetical protein
MLGVSIKLEKVDVDPARTKLLNMKRKSDQMIKNKRQVNSEEK